MRKIAALVMCVAAASCAPSGFERPASAAACPAPLGPLTRTRIEEVVASPKSFVGKPIEVEGFFYSYFEHSALYSTPESEPYGHRFASGLWVDSWEGVPDNQYVRLRGVVTSNKGHLGQWPATLCVTLATPRPAP